LGLFWFWLIVAGAFVVAEMLTLAFFAVFLAIGALGAALAALLGADLLVQAIIMGVVGVGGIFAGRPYLHRALGRHKPPRLRSGAEGMIGQHSVLLDPIGGSGQPGHVLIFGERWPALTGDGSALEANTPVVVTGIKSTTLIVERSSNLKTSTA
jgi:membrane protein implicated in regulation of membrane protease activity